MRLAPRLALATLASITGLTALAATPAAARTDVRIEYRDRDRDWRDHRDDREDRRDWREWHRDRDHDRWDGRYGRGGYGWRGDDRRCWTEWRYDYRFNERYPVRYCR